MLLAAVHEPEPLQVPRGVKVVPEQVVEPQAPVGNLHDGPLPSQIEAHSPLPGHEPRPPWGTPPTKPQVPAAPARLQNSHWPLQARSQQTPSMQRPETHWVPSEQPTPSAFLVMQVPAASQVVPPPVQRSSSAEITVTQWPLALQVWQGLSQAASQQT